MEQAIYSELIRSKDAEKLQAFKPQTQVIREFPSGTIEFQLGADGVWIRFDCDCADALPYCQAQCCALVGTFVFSEELEEAISEKDVELDHHGRYVMKRLSDGFCKCLNRQNRTCEIYENRPQTCRTFHCTRGANMRGLPLPNYVVRQSGVAL